MKYCRETTEQHPVCEQYPDELEFLNDIFNAEGLSCKLFDKEKGINLDKIEIRRCTGVTNRQPTMDFAIGISQNGKKNQMLLVELKLNIKNPGNIPKSEIETEIRHSTDILSHQPPISKEKIIIFGDNQLETAKSCMARLYCKSPKMSIVVKSSEDFLKEYFTK
jgi:hypothetical protein